MESKGKICRLTLPKGLYIWAAIEQVRNAITIGVCDKTMYNRQCTIGHVTWQYVDVSITWQGCNDIVECVHELGVHVLFRHMILVVKVYLQFKQSL